jgi:hypothetical protein
VTDLDQRTHDDPHHVVQERVAFDQEGQLVSRKRQLRPERVRIVS